MRARTLFPLLLLGALVLQAGCAAPPPAAYVGASGGSKGVPIGTNAAGESCTSVSLQGGANVYCGTWDQPSARIVAVRGGADALSNEASASPWRTAIDTRLACGAPAPTTIMQGTPALLMQCTARNGGWPYAALVTSIGGQLYDADGVAPALPAMERAVLVLSGRVSAAAAPQETQSAADALMAKRLATQAFKSGDVGTAEQLIALGIRANVSENFAASEQAFRAALALQQKILGRDDPDTATTLAYLGLQISDQGRFAEADAIFAHAAALAPRATDPTTMARVLHYRALGELNEGHNEKALADLRAAEAEYAAHVPQTLLHPPSPPPYTGPQLTTGISIATDQLAVDQPPLTEPEVQNALLGVIETRRYQGIVLRRLGRPADSEAKIQSAMALARGNRLTPPILRARLVRTEAKTDELQGRSSAAITGLAVSSSDFEQALPGTRPLAVTELLRAAELAHAGSDAAALAQCRAASNLLRRINAGVEPALLAPCLDIYGANAAHDPADRQALLAEMFQVAQLAQGGITSEQIAQATARLAENARDPHVAEAIRRRQDATKALSDLYRQRDELVQEHSGTADTTDLDTHIKAAQKTVANAEEALQAAAPNFGQLVQQVVPATAIFHALASGETFVDITLADNDGWTLAFHDGRISAARVPAGLKQMTALVKRVRAGMEPGANGLPPFDAAAATKIYADTLGGVAPALQDAKALVVAPAGPLLSLPFAILLTGPADPSNLAAAPWLIKRMTVAHVPAAANFVSLRKIAGGSRATKPWFGFGDFRPVTLAQAERTFPSSRCADSAKLFAGLPPLPFAKQELEAARALMGGSKSDELLGAAFTAAAVEKLNLKDYRVLHFATHALLPTDLACQTEPAIVTSDPPHAKDASGALLTGSDVVTLDLDADGVILSACNSGGPGGQTAGESLSGLARAFFYAGARALLVTHWSVNDRAAAFLVAKTLEAVHNGTGFAQALRGAQLSMIDGAGKTLPAEIANPFYWGAFALIGEGSGKAVSQSM